MTRASIAGKTVRNYCQAPRSCSSPVVRQGERMPSSRKREELGRELGVAATSGRVSAVQHLLAAGADKEVPTPLMGMMMTPLTAAAYTNNVRTTGELVHR